MLKVGDSVKIIDGTIYEGEKREFIPIGTICRIIGIIQINGEINALGLVPEEKLHYYNGTGEYYYLENEVEKGHLEWVKDE